MQHNTRDSVHPVTCSRVHSTPSQTHKSRPLREVLQGRYHAQLLARTDLLLDLHARAHAQPNTTRTSTQTSAHLTMAGCWVATSSHTSPPGARHPSRAATSISRTICRRVVMRSSAVNAMNSDMGKWWGVVGGWWLVSGGW